MKTEGPTKERIKPCPFCGSQPKIQPWHGGGPRKRLIGCDNDACLVMPACCGTTERRAIENWNYRAVENGQ
jgi:hypothetical protein